MAVFNAMQIAYYHAICTTDGGARWLGMVYHKPPTGEEHPHSVVRFSSVVWWENATNTWSFQFWIK